MRYPLTSSRATGLFLRALRASATALAALLLVTCTDNPIGPGRLTPAALQVRPVFDANARFAPLVLTSARLIVVRPATDTLSRVTGTFNATTNQVQLTATVLLHGLTEDLDVTLELYAGSVLIFSGTQRLTVGTGGGSQPQSIPVTYTGPGAQAASVSIAPQDTTVTTGSVTPMRATALDAQAAPIPQFYASWSLVGAPVGASIDAAGQLTAPATRDTFQVVVSTPTGLADTTFVFVAAAPATLVQVSGDNQSATVSTRLPQPLVVRVDGSDALPVSGVPVTFAVVSGGGALDSAVVTTDAAGLAAMGATLGATVGSQTFSATAAGLTGVTFTATGTASAGTRTWTGAVSANWNTAGNWSPGVVPTASDSVVVVGGTSNDPALTGNATIQALTMQGTNAGLTITGNLTVSGSVALPDTTQFIDFNSGQLQAGSVTIAGFSSFVDVSQGSATVPGTVSLTGDQAFMEVGPGSAVGATTLSGNAAFFSHFGGNSGPLTLSGASAFWEAANGATVTVTGAVTLSSSAFLSSFGGNGKVTFNGNVTLGGTGSFLSTSAGDHWTVNGNFQTSGGGRLTMTHASDTVEVNGNAFFGGGDETGQLIAGVLDLGGNFTQTGAATSFIASGTHKVLLTGAGPVNLSAAGGSSSPFNILDVSRAAGTITLGNTFAVGTLVSTPVATPPTINGAGNGMIISNGTQVTGLILNSVPTVISGGAVQLDNVTFQGFSVTANQLSFQHPGLASHISLNNAVFSTVPTSGLYIVVNDVDGATPNVLTVDMLNPTPATPGSSFALLGGGVLNWPVAAPGKTWTGAVDSAWNNGANWNPTGIPTTTDDVVIPSAPARQPVLTSGSPGRAQNLTVQSGATLTLGGPGVVVSGSFDGQGIVTGSSASLSLSGTGTARGTLTGTNFSLILSTGARYSLSGRLLAPSVVVNDSLTLAGHTLVAGSSAGDDFNVSNNGVLVMQNPLDSLIIAGVGPSISFDGASSVGAMTAGVILVNNSTFATFSQGSTFNPASFAPSGTHKTVFAGAGSVNMTMSTPGAGSAFNTMDISAAVGGFSWSSPIRVNGLLISTPGGTTPAINGGNRLLTAAGGTNITGLTLTNAPLAITGGSSVTLDNVTWQSMISSATQLTVDHPGLVAHLVFNNLVFSGTPTTGFYINANDTDGASPNILTIDLVNPTPATPSTFATATNGAVINWPAATPVKTWTGAATSDWQTSTNWNPAGIPVATDDVVIPATGNQPVMSAAVSIRNLTVQSGALVNLNSFALNLTGDLVAPNATSFIGGGGTLSLLGTGRTVGGTLSSALPVNVSGTYQLTARTVVGGLTLSGTGDIAANGNTLVVGGALNTTGSGTLTMTNALDSVLVTGAGIFGGGFTGGRLTAGYLKIGGSFNQTSGTTPGSFAASGSHTTELGAAAVRVVTFASPGSGTGTSQFNNLIVTGATGGLTLNSSVTLVGTLISLPSGTTPTLTATAGRTLTVQGGTQVIGLILDGLPVFLDLGGGGSLQFDDAIFQNMLTGSTQLTILHPGTPAPIVLTDLVFNTTPAAGAFYLSATDVDGVSPDALVLDLAAPTPATDGGFSQALGGAVINWPQAAPVKTWTGSVSTDWSVAGNWSPAGVPTATDDVNIPLSTPIATVTSSCTAKSLTVVGTMDLGTNNCTVLGNVDASGVIAGTSGAIVLTAAAQIQGNFPNLVVSAPVALTNAVGLGAGNGNVTITGVGAALTLSGNPMVIQGNLSVQGAGVLVMTNPTDLITVQGSATFDGGDETGKLTDGVLTVFGNFSQAATSSGASFQASGNHQTVLGGSTISVTFATPGTSGPTSRFQELSWNQNGTMTLGSNLMVAGLYHSFGGNSTMIAASEEVLTVAGFDPGGVKTFDNVRLIVSDAAGATALNFNNLVFQNMQPTSIQLQVLHPGTGGPFNWVGLTFSTVPTSGFYLSATDLNTGDGVPLTIDVSGATPATGAPFVQTAGGAVVNWPAGAGTQTWTGATSTDWFTASNWSGGIVPNAASDVVIPPSTPNAPTINSNTAINSLVIQAGAVLTTNDISLDIAGNVDASGLLTGCCGDFIGLTNGTLRGNFDNVLLSVAAGGVVTLNGATFLTNGTVSLNGELILAGNPLSAPQLQVAGAGLLTMTTPGDIVVASSVDFAGGDETGHLTDGVISTQNFTQGNSGTGGNLSFVATLSHQVLIGGPSSSQIAFASPAQSHFAGLNLSGVAATVTLGSDVTVTGLLAATPSATPPVVTTVVGAKLTAQDLVTTGLTFDGVPLVLTNVVSPLLHKVTFQNMDPTITQLTVSGVGSGSTITFDTLDFQTTPTTGLYLQLDDLDGPSPNALTVDVLNSNPAAGAPFTQANNGAVLNWTPPPAFNWTGTTSSDWFTGTNWSGGGVPTAADSPVILASAPNQPVLTAGVTVTNLTIQPGATVDIGTNNLVITGSLDDGGVINGAGRATVALAGAGQFARGAINATTTVSGSYALNGRLSVTNSFSVNGGGASLTLNGNTAEVINFTAGVGGLLVMLNGLDSLIVSGDAILDGGSTAGLLTAGTVVVSGDFVQTNTNSTTSYAPSGSHTTVFAPTVAGHTIAFNTPGAGASQFQFLRVAGTAPVTLNTNVRVGADVVVSQGDLTIGGKTLTVIGAFQTTGSGSFTEASPTDSVLVTGAGIFGGGSTSGRLTDGFLRLGGSFSQTSANSTQSFAASGAHRTAMGSGGVRVVTFASPGTGAAGSHFNSLDMTAATGGLTLNSNVFVDGALQNSIGAGASLLTMNGKILTAHQFAVAGNLTVDNPQLVLDEGGVGAVQTFNSVVFQNNAATTMLKVIGVGSALAARTITFNGLTFPTTGSNTYVDLTSSNGFGLNLIVAGSNTPTGGPSRSIPPFGTTVNGATVIWQ